MRILLLCKRHYTNKDLLADRFGRLYHLPLNWSREHSVSVICLDYRSKVPERLRTGQLDILSLPARPGHLLQTLLTLRREVDAFDPTVLVASSDIIYGIAGLVLARARGIPFAYDLYDDYRAFRINRLTGLRRAFLPVCRRADLLISASAPLASALSTSNPNRVLVPNGYDPQVFNQVGPRASREALGLCAEDKLLIYSGAPGLNLDLPVLLGALAQLNEAGIRAKCLIVGPGTERLAGLSPFLVPHHALPQADLASLLRSADIGVAPYRLTEQTRVSAPCKIAEFLACGLPCVVAGVSDVANLTGQGVLTYEPGSADGLYRRLREALASPPAVTPSRDAHWEALARRALDALATTAARTPR